MDINIKKMKKTIDKLIYKCKNIPYKGGIYESSEFSGTDHQRFGA